MRGQQDASLRTASSPARPAAEPTAAPVAPAFVLGDVDLVTGLALAGIPSVVVAPDGDPVRLSRHVVGSVPWVDHWSRPEQLVQHLLDAAQGLAERPVLYFQSDGDLLVVSRHRDVLRESFRFVVADRDLVEDVVDKARFAGRAAAHGLPVPATVVCAPGRAPWGALDGLRLPVVVKPWSRHGLLQLGRPGKAVRADDRRQLHEQVEHAQRQGVGTVVQELVPGPEAAVESYHGYVDARGTVVADFTGAKVRTQPRQFGHSSVLVTTSAPDVRAAGRDVVARLALQGVVKADFKRDPQGRLWLLEVNPRFTLWQHLGAVAGCNLAALVHADLTGAPRPAVGEARPGLVWCDPVRDLRGVLAGEVRADRWARTVLTCDARSGGSPGDRRPLLQGRLWGTLQRTARGRRAA